MKTLFHAADTEEMLQRIRRLRPDSRPLWGKMNAAQMLAHYQVAMSLATGELVLKRALIGILFGRIAKKQLLADKPFGHSLPTAAEFKIGDARDFAREKAGAIARIQAFQRGGPAVLSKEPHPFFGPLQVTEWEALQWKHLDHHLRQFGV